MANHIIPHFHNDSGVEKIEIGVKEFKCVGASSPNDHPHIFLDMGHDDEKLCPYCSTRYVYNGDLKADESKPENCLVKS